MLESSYSGGKMLPNDNKFKRKPKKMFYDIFFNLVYVIKRVYICNVILKTIFLP